MGRKTVHVGTGAHLSGKRFNQDLRVNQGLNPQKDTIRRWSKSRNDNQARALFRLFMQSVAVITVTSPWKGVCVALVSPSA